MSGDYTAERDALILLCRKLEAERDEARAQRDEYKEICATALDQLLRATSRIGWTKP